MSERLIKAIDDVKHLPEISLGEIVDTIGDESLLIVSLVTILPFLQPIPIPGLSTILGAIIFLQGIGLCIHGRPLLTQKMREVKLSQEKMLMVHKAATKFDRFTSKISVFKHPFISSRASRVICGSVIAFAAAFLSLPLPIPFSNFVPALCIFFICAGLLENDVILVLFGIGIGLTVIWMAVMSYHLIENFLTYWF